MATIRVHAPTLSPALGAAVSTAVRRGALEAAGAGVRASMLVTPRLAAFLIRETFRRSGLRTAASLMRHAPVGVEALRDLRYGPEPDMLLDVFRPADGDGPHPLLLWVHGGGFVGGSKDELAGYFQMIASHGYTVAAPRYALAPKYRYPVPVRQVMRALDFLQAERTSFHLDPDRIILAGNSAGAHIAAQIGTLATTPGYAGLVGIPPTIAAEQVRGLVLACGTFDLSLTLGVSGLAESILVRAAGWSYSGRRNFNRDITFAAWSIPDFLTPAFPPTLLTVGNADPLRAHTERLHEAMRAAGLEPETVFWPDHVPALDHEYQFNLDTEPAQVFRSRLLEFLAAKTGADGAGYASPGR
ncbi:alpha/beta hydrolase [Sinomonas sp. P10A9]|uniref:Alpha/beta hydrolase n=1 Tax=Sinomonas puerhi TaxID=3238584 RepID=A0AB39L1S3_9MICC